MKKIINKKIFLGLLVLIIVGLIGVTAYFYFQYQKIRQNPDLIAHQEISLITKDIGRYMDLPADEEPTVATVTDKEKLNDQEFFQKAENGDKVLIYAKARKAILYRPSKNRIIDFAPLLLDGRVQIEDQVRDLENEDLEQGEKAGFEGNL